MTSNNSVCIFNSYSANSSRICADRLKFYINRLSILIYNKKAKMNCIQIVF